MPVAEAGDGLELGFDAGFLQHFALDGLGQMLAGVQGAAGEFQGGGAAGDAVDFPHYQQLALRGKHHAADADVVGGEVGQPGAFLEDGGEH